MAKKDLRGRPTKSQIRDNLIEILHFVGEGYGYELYKTYVDVFQQKVNIRSIYYHLNKGVDLGEFIIKNVESVPGNYSWGDQVKRIVFSLGPMAKPRGNQTVAARLSNKED